MRCSVAESQLAAGQAQILKLESALRLAAETRPGKERVSTLSNEVKIGEKLK